MVPMLPCADVEAMVEFWAALGLRRTDHQLRRQPSGAVTLGGIELQYYRVDGWEPAQSHSTCAVVVPDTRPLFELFSAGLRALYGRVPVAGFPRITRPRERAGDGGLSGFSVIDPAGNWVRVMRTPVPVEDEAAAPEPEPQDTRPPVERARALAADVQKAVADGDADTGRALLADLEALVARNPSRGARSALAEARAAVASAR